MGIKCHLKSNWVHTFPNQQLMSLLVNHIRVHSQSPPAEILNIIIAILQQECSSEELRSCYAKMGLIWRDYFPYMRSLLFHEVSFGYPAPKRCKAREQISTLTWGTGNRVLLPGATGRPKNVTRPAHPRAATTCVVDATHHLLERGTSPG